VTSPLLGTHNVYNVLAATAIALEHAINAIEVAAACRRLNLATNATGRPTG